MRSKNIILLITALCICIVSVGCNAKIVSNGGKEQAESSNIISEVSTVTENSTAVESKWKISKDENNISYLDYKSKGEYGNTVKIWFPLTAHLAFSNNGNKVKAYFTLYEDDTSPVKNRFGELKSCEIRVTDNDGVLRIFNAHIDANDNRFIINDEDIKEFTNILKSSEYIKVHISFYTAYYDFKIETSDFAERYNKFI